jgi:hypothetical protein
MLGAGSDQSKISHWERAKRMPRRAALMGPLAKIKG